MRIKLFHHINPLFQILDLFGPIPGWKPNPLMVNVINKQWTLGRTR